MTTTPAKHYGVRTRRRAAIVDVLGIADSQGRADGRHDPLPIPDGSEREAEDPRSFYRFSPDAYSVGIDVVLHAFTHCSNRSRDQQSQSSDHRRIIARIQKPLVTWQGDNR
jgi:hypothetical protein